MFRELVILIDAIFQSLKTLCWVLLLLVLLLYIYAIACVELIGTNKDYSAFDRDSSALASVADDFNNYQYFGTVIRAMNTLFGLITLSEWSLISRPVSEQQPLAMILLVLFTMSTTYGVMNVVIGAMVEHALDAAQEFRRLEVTHEKDEQCHS